MFRCNSENDPENILLIIWLNTWKIINISYKGSGGSGREVAVVAKAVVVAVSKAAVAVVAMVAAVVVAVAMVVVEVNSGMVAAEELVMVASKIVWWWPW